MPAPHETPPAPAPVSIRVLGPLTATVAGSPADLGGPRQRAVLARLAAAGGHVVPADRLVDDLWGAEDPARALAVLQVQVSHLRRALEPHRPRRAPAQVLVSAAPGYALRLPPEACDAWRFEALVRRASDEPEPRARRQLLDAALTDWRGTPYAEVRDTAWAAPEIARLEELRLGAIEARAAADLDLRRPGAAVPDLERLLHDQPGREETARLLALALYRSGRQGDALAVLRRVRSYLAGELGVDPGAALRALEAAILAQSPELDLSGPAEAAGPLPTGPARSGPSPELAAAPGPVAPPAAHVVALGRDRELAAIAAAGAQARTGGARVVWVGADAGAGKTTLAEAAAGALTAGGWRVARGRCPEVDGAPPGWMWAGVLRGLDEPAGADADPAARTAFGLARDVVSALGRAAADGPVAVVLDDLHRADDLTLQVLRAVAGELARLPILILGTYRTAEAGEEFAATRAALVPVTTHHVHLEGLGPDAVAALAATAGLTDPDPDVLAALTERTGGNPLFVREFARLITAAGPEAARTAVPDGVREVLRRRVARLPGDAAATLRQAAVLGRETDADLLAAVAGRDPDDVIDALETAVLAGLLDEPAPGRIRFTHALVRDTLYDDTPLVRRARWHAAALAALRDRPGTDAALLARHAVAAAGPADAHEAVPFAVAAAREAEALGAHRVAARHWLSALHLHETAERAPGTPAERQAELVGLLTGAVTALARAGDAAGARAAYLRAVGVARGSDRRDLLAGVLTAWDAPLVWTTRASRAPDEDVVVAVHEALATTTKAGAGRAALLLALFRELEGYDVPAAIEASAEALRLAREAHDGGEPGAVRLLCAALNARAYAALGPDLAGERRAIAEEYLRHAEAAGEQDHEAVARWLLFLEAAARTDLGAAFGHVARAVARCDGGRLEHLLAVLEIFAALCDVLAGRPEEGRRRYEEVARLLVEHGASNGALMGLIGRLTVAFAAGDLTPVRPELEAVEQVFPGELVDPLTLALLDEGREDDARRVWAGRRPLPRHYYWLGFTTMRALAAARLGDRTAAAGLYAELSPFAGRIAGLDSGTLAVGPVDEALAALAELLDRHDEATERRQAARELRAGLTAALAGLLDRPDGS